MDDRRCRLKSDNGAGSYGRSGGVRWWKSTQSGIGRNGDRRTYRGGVIKRRFVSPRTVENESLEKIQVWWTSCFCYGLESYNRPTVNPGSCTVHIHDIHCTTHEVDRVLPGTHLSPIVVMINKPERRPLRLRTQGSIPLSSVVGGRCHHPIPVHTVGRTQTVGDRGQSLPESRPGVLDRRNRVGSHLYVCGSPRERSKLQTSPRRRTEDRDGVR